jgi:hypothetical protein
MASTVLFMLRVIVRVDGTSTGPGAIGVLIGED